MTKRWKLKTTSSNILLVLITLILVKAEWVEGENENSWETTLQKMDSNYTGNISEGTNETHIYVGNDEIAEYFFYPSTKNSSFILEGINKCLDSFQLITCVKMLLLNRVNDALGWMKEPDIMQKDVVLLNGLLVFKRKNDTSSVPDEENNDLDLSLDEEIVAKVRRIFHRRSLIFNFLPKYKFEIEPIPGKRLDDFICFRYKEVEQTSGDNVGVNEGRKKGGMPMMMIVPPLIMLGLMPFTLASLKAMVMNAVMINMMALNGAIFMTIRNLVFGPRKGDNVKYVNYGYSKDRQTQSKRPVLIIHSPAAFVKQPPVHKNNVHGHEGHHEHHGHHGHQEHQEHHGHHGHQEHQEHHGHHGHHEHHGHHGHHEHHEHHEHHGHHGHHEDYEHPSAYDGQDYFPESHNTNSGSSDHYHYQHTENNDDYEGSYYTIHGEGNLYDEYGQNILKRNELAHMNGYYNFNVTNRATNKFRNSNQRIYGHTESNKKPKYKNTQIIPSTAQKNTGNYKVKVKYN